MIAANVSVFSTVVSLVIETVTYFDVWPEEQRAIDRLVKKHRVTKTELLRYLIRKAAGLSVLFVPTTDEEHAQAELDKHLEEIGPANDDTD